MTYHDLSPELQEKVRANTIAEEVRNGKTNDEALAIFELRNERHETIQAYFFFNDAPEGKGYWWDVMNGKIK